MSRPLRRPRSPAATRRRSWWAVAGSFVFAATGSPTPAIAVTGTLPAGVTYNAGTKTLSGTPGAGTGGSYALTVTASNGVGSNATQAFTLVVNQAPAITSSNTTTFVAGSGGSFVFTATGTPAPAVTITGNLPAGVTYNAGTKTLSGTPGAGTGGSYALTVTASNGVGSNATQAFTLVVNQAPAVTSANSTKFVGGSSGSFVFTATGSPAPAIAVTGTLPAGVTYNAGTKTLSGDTGGGDRRQLCADGDGEQWCGQQRDAGLYARRESGAEDNQRQQRDVQGGGCRHGHRHQHRLPAADLERKRYSCLRGHVHSWYWRAGGNAGHRDHRDLSADVHRQQWCRQQRDAGLYADGPGAYAGLHRGHGGVRAVDDGQHSVCNRTSGNRQGRGQWRGVGRQRDVHVTRHRRRAAPSRAAPRRSPSPPAPPVWRPPRSSRPTAPQAATPLRPPCQGWQLRPPSRSQTCRWHRSADCHRGCRSKFAGQHRFCTSASCPGPGCRWQSDAQRDGHMVGTRIGRERLAEQCRAASPT